MKKILFGIMLIMCFVVSVMIGIEIFELTELKKDNYKRINKKDNTYKEDDVFVAAGIENEEKWKEFDIDDAKIREENDTVEETAVSPSMDYSEESSWVYRPNTHINDVDVFFLCPTSIQGKDYDIDLDDEEERKIFAGTVNIEKGIYDDMADFYAPYYKQMNLSGYYDTVPLELRNQYLDAAYEDVSAAFKMYLDNYNDGRPILLAGFSQGSDMMKRLLKEYDISDRLVAAYMIGWNITEEDLEECPRLKMAKGELDTGVIISFCSESENNSSSVIVPDKTIGINPLNWKTDSTLANYSQNIGSCFTGYDSSIIEEEIGLCGCYLDENRGTLKVKDVSPERFPPDLGFLNSGDYHVYDFIFFYRNLEKNVQYRIQTYLGKSEDELIYNKTEGPAPKYTQHEIISNNNLAAN